MSKVSERQDFIRFWRDQTGESEIDFHDVAKLAAEMGWSLPKPADPVDLLAKEFRNAARQVVRYDKETNRPYRGYHAVPSGIDKRGQQTYFWFDIDDPNATTSNYRKSSVMKREQMVDDGVQITLNDEHWNRLHPDPKDQVHSPMDFTLDVEIRLAAMDIKDDQDAA